MDSMKVVVDATTLLLRSAGVKNYVHFWLSSLQKAACLKGDIVATYPPGLHVSNEIDHERSSASAVDTYLRLKLVQLGNIRMNPLLDLLVSDADVFHASQHTARVPKRSKATATVFDLSCWTAPETHTAENIAATRRYGEKILKACDGLIAISAHARDDAIAILGIPEARIRVIYPGVSERFFCATADEATSVRKEYGITSPYLLFVGCIEPRKNVSGLIEAFRRLPERLRRDLQLIIAGPFGWASEDLYKLLMSGSVKGMRYLGYVPEEHLPGLVRGAIALTYPSYYEGFGFPAAQAMAAGIPVIASNRSCLPEIVGNAGLLADPNSVEELSDAMERIATCPSLTADLARQGRANAERFRWPICAAQSLKFFHELAGRS
jgi:alpha-1,3-rhamnosyl/mannosyltransferase